MPSDIRYDQTIDYLYGLQKHGIKLGLDNTLTLLERVGNPERKFRAVHVAGTNGKGSTSVFLASMLTSAGHRVGLYTSPHLISFTERVRVNNAPITEQCVVELADRIRGVAHGLNPTFFEVTTVLAFLHFAERMIDIAVIETGMGGRLDSTNAILPLASIITNISLEHTEFLGDTIEKIAAEKAGIIKPRVPVITAAEGIAAEVIVREADAKSAPVLRFKKDFMADLVGKQSFYYRGASLRLDGLSIGMLGAYQIANASLALAAVERLRAVGMTIGDAAIRDGLSSARWEGRMELMRRHPDLYLDGAHNPASAAVLAETVREMRSDYRRLILVIGILGDKDYRAIIQTLSPLADSVIVTRPNYGRAMDVATLAGEIGRLHHSVATAATLSDALELAHRRAAPDDLILVTGSLYVVGDARAILVADPARHSPLTGLK